MIQKIIKGYVVQRFNDDGTPASQNFISTGGIAEWENEEGMIIDTPKNPTSFPVYMVQPEPPNPEFPKSKCRYGADHDQLDICDACPQATYHRCARRFVELRKV